MKLFYIILIFLIIPILCFPAYEIENKYIKISIDDETGRFYAEINKKHQSKFNFFDSIIFEQCDWPPTSYALLNINNDDYILGSEYGRRIKCKIIENKILYIWKVDEIIIEQVLSLIDEFNIKIDYKIKNDSDESKKVGLNLYLDLLLYSGELRLFSRESGRIEPYKNKCCKEIFLSPVDNETPYIFSLKSSADNLIFGDYKYFISGRKEKINKIDDLCLSYAWEPILIKKKRSVNYSVEAGFKKLILPPQIKITKTKNTNYPEFDINIKNVYNISKWELIIYDNELKPVKRVTGSNKPGDRILIKDIELLKGTFYHYELIITDDSNSQLKSNRGSFITRPLVIETDKEIIFDFPAVNFNFGSAGLKRYSYSILDMIAEKLNSISENKIRIDGHTDNIGNPESNLILSEQRALAVMNYFLGVKGFNEDRFLIKGYGDKKPKASNETEAGREKNRRVEIIIEK